MKLELNGETDHVSWRGKLDTAREDAHTGLESSLKNSWAKITQSPLNHSSNSRRHRRPDVELPALPCF